MRIDNRTPFHMGRAVFLDKNAAENLVVALKATYKFDASGTLRIAEEQIPIALADEFHGDPAHSSILQESEIGPVRPATDVFLQASAVARERNTRQLQVGIRLGPCEMYANVFGDRVWENRMGRPAASAPEPFESIPLYWELSYGGLDMTASSPANYDSEKRNPVGRGFRAQKTEAEWVGTLLPNIEHPAEAYSSVGQRVTPVGFAPVGRNWEPRVQYAGTYDKEWQERRAPLLPKDFDERFHNAAPTGLIAPGHLAGELRAEVYGCSLTGYDVINIPDVFPQVAVAMNGSWSAMEMPLNSITVDMWRNEVRMLWKGEMNIHRKLLSVSSIQCRMKENS